MGNSFLGHLPPNNQWLVSLGPHFYLVVEEKNIKNSVNETEIKIRLCIQLLVVQHDIATGSSGSWTKLPKIPPVELEFPVCKTDSKDMKRIFRFNSLKEKRWTAFYWKPCGHTRLLKIDPFVSKFVQKILIQISKTTHIESRLNCTCMQIFNSVLVLTSFH